MPVMIEKTLFILDLIFILLGISLIAADMHIYNQIGIWTFINTGLIIIAFMIIIMGTVSLVSDIRDAVRRAKLFDRQV